MTSGLGEVGAVGWAQPRLGCQQVRSAQVRLGRVRPGSHVGQVRSSFRLESLPKKRALLTKKLGDRVGG